MTNEEIVARIQAGEVDLMETLWVHVERFAAWKSSRVIRALNGFGGVEFGDLYNSCYLALIDAVKTYNPDNGAFTTWFMFYIQTAFAVITGNRTMRARNDPLRNYVSLSTSIGDDDTDGMLSDVTPDPHGQDSLISTEARIMYEQIQRELDRALSMIPPEQGHILQQHYLKGKTIETIGQEMGIAASVIQNTEYKAIRAMRQPRISKRLKPLYEDFDFYGCSSMSSFRRSGMSIQEQYVIQKEKEKA